MDCQVTSWERADLIEAPVERVWEVTTDVERWPTFLPTINNITLLDRPPLRPGSRARIQQPGMDAEWTVERIDPLDRFVWSTDWKGRRLVGEHRVQAVEEGTVNTLRIELRGKAGPILRAFMWPLMRSTLAREAKGFRQAAESSA